MRYEEMETVVATAFSMFSLYLPMLAMCKINFIMLQLITYVLYT